MASKTYEGRQASPENIAKPCKPNTNGGGSGVLIRGSGDSGGGDDEPDGDHEEECAQLVGSGHDDETKKKKRKRSKKKKKNAAKGGNGQSSPPRIPVLELFPSGNYPRGENLAYKDENTTRTTGEEVRYLERFDDKFLEDYRHGAEVHRQVRQWSQANIKPGQTLTEIAEGIEEGVRALLGNQGLEPGGGLKSGMGFPTGLCLNNCAAHFTPNVGAKELILQKQDVMKIDFGVHINGRIVDSAFTMAFDPVYDNLLAAVKDATNTGIKVSKTMVSISTFRLCSYITRKLASMLEWVRSVV
ncbi:methionine type [Phlyctema vagabunda]|uniref:Methionine type n=1 Tax=Phlyctema vagabunda TaxID=108571 RepID=A0ABR4PA04_9HELO